MHKFLKGQWPIMVFALMFFILPLSTIPGLFDPIFIVLGLFTLVILILIVASLVTGRSQATNGE
jgi:hypothetical protein